MKFIITLITVLLVSSTFGQKSVSKNKKIIEIRKLYNDINKFSKYRIIKIEDSEELLGEIVDNGASIEGYYNGRKLNKIVEWIGLSNKVIQNEYYFSNEKLFFVYSVESNYKYDENTGSYDYSKSEITFNGR